MLSGLLKWAALLLAVLFAGSQLFRPDRTNPPTDGAKMSAEGILMSSAVKPIFDRACLDCHSNETRWPWYSHVAPVSWLVINDVREAREHMNLSEWAKYNREEAADLLGKICKETSGGDMPLPSYVWMHRGAKLSPEDVRTLCEWSRSARQQLTQAK